MSEKVFNTEEMTIGEFLDILVKNNVIEKYDDDQLERMVKFDTTIDENITIKREDVDTMLYITTGYVKDLNSDRNYERYSFVSDSQDVQAIKDDLGGERLVSTAGDFSSFFVDIEDGEYKEVWGMNGIVPYLDKAVYRIK